MNRWPSDGAEAAAALRTDDVSRTVYATDNSIYQVHPFAVSHPRSVDDVEALVRANAQADQPRPIVARGGGTGTNGQSLTDGIVIDCRRHLNRILEIDVDRLIARVEPGVVAGRLNAELATHGLFWAPHTSTLNRCTVGGMIATDAAGKGSLVHGRCHRHVVALDVVLDDGTPWRAEPISISEAGVRAKNDDRSGQLWRRLIDLPLSQGHDVALPELARGFSGYGIDRLRRDDLIDPVPLLVGSEGTLAITASATIKLTPLPTSTALVIASYQSFADALDDAIEVAVTKPTAIECFDETTLAQGRHSPAWPSLQPIVGERSGAVLLIEYASGATAVEPDLTPIVTALADTGRSVASRVVTDPNTQAAAWKVRADAVGLVAKMAVGGPSQAARPTAFVEDCAVPVHQMPGFIARFRGLLDDRGLTYAMFGHADVGCVHVRPALDLTDPAHEALIAVITDEVVDLVAEHGGVLWGEHGRGFRGDRAPAFLTEETIDIMRKVKSAFDPNDRFNPGKLYRPTEVDEPLLAIDAPTTRGSIDRSVPVEIRRRFDTAFACNGNGLCQHFASAEVMCPSYKASGDPALSPKGRADLIRAWLADRGNDGRSQDPAGFEDAIATNLHRCLSCSACTGHCPVAVDIPELKSLFLFEYHKRVRRPPSHALLSRFESMIDRVGLVPPAVTNVGRAIVERTLGFVDLPVPPRQGRRERNRLPRFDPTSPSATPPDVVLLPDIFTRSLEPWTLVAAHRVLSELGWSVQIAPVVPSGKFDHVKGRRMVFSRAVAAQARLVSAITASGAIPVGIEPAVTLLHDHEYPAAASDYPADTVLGLPALIEQRLDRIEPRAAPSTITLLGHCTERATRPAWLAAWVSVLTRAGHTVTSPELGCCGMAGIFGHERDNQAMSKHLYELGWATTVQPDVADLGRSGPVVVATGYSCRSQIKRFGGRTVDHPIHLL